MEKGIGWKKASTEEKRAYIELLIWIVTSDGKFPIEQRELVVELLNKLEIPLKDERKLLKKFFQTPSEEGIKKSIDALKNSPLRFSALADVITLALIDNEIEEKEKKVIKQLASRLNITEKQFQSIYLTIIEARRLMKQKTTKDEKNNILNKLNNPLLGVGVPILLSIIANTGLGGSAFLVWLSLESIAVLRKIFK